MQWTVPLSDIDFGEEETTAVNRVLNSRWLSMGEVTQHFETDMADFLGCKHALAVSNGTTALHLAFATLGLGTGDEVILPSLTFVATANAVLYTGARPVFVDITSLDDLTLSIEAIENQITPHTRAIAVMHYGGYLCAMPEILEIARRHNLAVIEDAAHAPGAAYQNKKAGTYGEVGCFSFFANKNLVTGEGGMITTNRDDLAERIRLMRSHGMTTLTWDRHHGHAGSYDVVALGYNYRLDEIHAALGLVQLGKLEANNERRGRIVEAYCQGLGTLKEISIPFQAGRFLDPAWRASYHLFPILLDPTIQREQFVNYLRHRGIQTSLHYPPIHLFTYYREQVGTSRLRLPLTETAAQRLVTLPLYASMTKEQVQAVIQAIHEAVTVHLCERF